MKHQYPITSKALPFIKAALVRKVVREHAASFAGEKEQHIEHGIILPDGSFRWLHAKGKLRNDERGRRIFFEGSVPDITEFKTPEIKLKETIVQQSLFVSIVNSCDDAIASKTPDGIITSWNRGAETIFGSAVTKIFSSLPYNIKKHASFPQ